VPVAFTEFLRDTQQIGLGVRVGIGDWVNQLEWNKQAYTLAFVQRPDFVAAYPNTMNATDVVNKMETNSGITLPAAQKTELINLLGLDRLMFQDELLCLARNRRVAGLVRR
jgi:hypothetical protein